MANYSPAVYDSSYGQYLAIPHASTGTVTIMLVMRFEARTAKLACLDHDALRSVQITFSVLSII